MKHGDYCTTITWPVRAVKGFSLRGPPCNFIVTCGVGVVVGGGCGGDGICKNLFNIFRFFFFSIFFWERGAWPPPSCWFNPSQLATFKMPNLYAWDTSLQCFWCDINATQYPRSKIDQPPMEFIKSKDGFNY